MSMEAIGDFIVLSDFVCDVVVPSHVKRLGSGGFAAVMENVCWSGQPSITTLQTLEERYTNRYRHYHGFLRRQSILQIQ
jgi:hypothetical protein